jgi:hypothetical protein
MQDFAAQETLETTSELELMSPLFTPALQRPQGASALANATHK